MLLMGFFLVRGRGRHGVLTASLPIAVLPMALVWFQATRDMINGLRAIALEAGAGPTMLEAFESVRVMTKSGSIATLFLLGCILLVGILMLREPAVSPPVTSRGRSTALLLVAAACVLTAMCAGALGARFFPQPIAILASDRPIDPEALPLSSRSIAELDLDNLGAVTLDLSNQITAIALVSTIAIAVCVLSTILASVLTLTGDVSRWAIHLALGLTLLAGITAAGQARRLDAMESEVELVRVTLVTSSLPQPHAPEAPDPVVDEPVPEVVHLPDGGILVEGAIPPPRKIVDVHPVYPQEAIDARAMGTVVLEALIDPRGNVTRVNVLRSVPLLDQAAIDAVKQWRYEPTLVEGIGVPVLNKVNVSFQLE